MKKQTKYHIQWLTIPIILTWFLYSFLTMKLNPFYWGVECRIMSVATLLALYWIFAKIMFSNNKTEMKDEDE